MATILLVDDHEADRALPATWLRRKGHRVLEAASADAALDLVRTEQPDLVLADVLMVALNGFGAGLAAVLGELRLPRLIYSAPAFLLAEAGALAAAHGGRQVIPKPFQMQEVLDPVNAALAEPSDAPGALPDEGAVDRYLLSVSEKLRRRAVEVEQLAIDLEQRLSDSVGKLETAREALEQEVSKRLWAEEELTRANRRLHEQAMRDVLTGLYNRRYLMESFTRELHRARRSSEELGVMIIDIDHFKRFNDTFGHAAGDAVLCAVARYMLSLIRGEDILCRFGGEEFVLVQAKASAEAVMLRAEKFRREVGGIEIVHEGRRLGPVTLSIGISMFPDHATSAEALLQAADAALYRAKGTGRNRVVMSDGTQEMLQEGAEAARPLQAEGF